MKISDWLDKKEAKGVDVSQIALPGGLSYDEAPDETIYFEEIILTESFLQSSALDTGIIVGVAARQPALTHQGWSGGCLQRIKISLSNS